MPVRKSHIPVINLLRVLYGKTKLLKNMNQKALILIDKLVQMSTTPVNWPPVPF